MTAGALTERPLQRSFNIRRVCVITGAIACNNVAGITQVNNFRPVTQQMLESLRPNDLLMSRAAVEVREILFRPAPSQGPGESK